jgi:hypothetical protein
MSRTDPDGDAMMTYTMAVERHSYSLATGGSLAVELPSLKSSRTGLIASSRSMAMTITGTDSGRVPVVIRVVDEPATVDLDGWRDAGCDDVAEASIATDADCLWLMNSAEDDNRLVYLPAPGVYRIRAFASGRDEAHDAGFADTSGLERSRLEIWAAPYRPPVL